MSYITNKYNYEFSYPSKNIPDWSSLVDRWYQLDAHSFGLADFYWKHKDILINKPGIIILTSDTGSLEADLQFVKIFSPTKFVYTLPNVRSSALCQVMNWHGPILCVQQPPTCLESGILEATSWAVNEHGCTWVIDVKDREIGKYVVQFIELSYKETNE